MTRGPLPILPSGRIAERDLHREAAWMPTFQRTMNTITALFGPGVIGANAVLGVVMLPLFMTTLALVEAGVRRLPVQRARWDAEGLTLDGPKQAHWRWEDIDELGFKKDDPHQIRFLVGGQEHWLGGPSDPKARDALLAHWKVYLTGEEQPLEARDPQWFDAMESKEARFRFFEGPASVEPTPSALRPALWMAAVLTTFAVLFVVFPVTDGFFPTLLALLALVAAASVPVGMAMASFVASQKNGALRVDQHGLTVAPVGGEERRFNWDAITALEHDELELRLKTDEGAFTYDFTALRVDRTRGLMGELEQRWRSRKGEEPAGDERSALRRLQRAAEKAR